MDEVEEPVESAAATQPVPMPAARSGLLLRGFAGDAGIVVVGSIVANLFNYLFHFTLSRRLGPADYGVLTTVLAMSAIVAVVGSSITIVAMQESARLWARRAEAQVSAFVRRAAPAVIATALITAVVLLGASIPLAKYLHIRQPLIWVLFAAYISVGIVSGFCRGAVQGAHRFWLYSGSLVGEASLKFAGGFALVAAGYSVFGAIGALLSGALFGLLIVAWPAVFGPAAQLQATRSAFSLGGESLKVMYVNVAATLLFFVDMVFAKHFLSGVAAGHYGAAGTIARTIPYGVGFVAAVLGPKAAAAHHVSRATLRRILQMGFGLAGLVIIVGLCCTTFIPDILLKVAYGPAFTDAAPILRWYGVDAALLALGNLSAYYFVATRDYAVGIALLGAVAVEAVILATFGTTPFRLLGTGIGVNAALLPVFAWFLVRSVRATPAAET